MSNVQIRKSSELSTITHDVRTVRKTCQTECQQEDSDVTLADKTTEALNSSPAERATGL